MARRRRTYPAEYRQQLVEMARAGRSALGYRSPFNFERAHQMALAA